MYIAISQNFDQCLYDMLIKAKHIVAVNHPVHNTQLSGITAIYNI